MQNYGTSMIGSFVVERVTSLPVWTSHDIGRFLYDITTLNYYLGAPSINDGRSGWIPIGIVSNIIKKDNVDWDVNITNRPGSISAKDLPVLYHGSPDNVQNVLSEIENNLQDIKKGNYLATESIKDYHLLTYGANAITAQTIPTENAKGIFPPTGGSVVTIEEALDYLYTRRAHDILLKHDPSTSASFSDPNIFGNKLSLGRLVSIQDGLDALEDYIFNLDASQIKCTYKGCACTTNVQNVLDTLYKDFSSFKFIELQDTPGVYDSARPYLKAVGSTLTWVALDASDVNCTFKSSKVSTQYAITNLESLTNSLSYTLSSLSLTAAKVAYPYTSSFYTFTEVQSALDAILNDFYSPRHKPTAGEISCVNIASSPNPPINTVQLALTYLDSELTFLKSSLPCNVSAPSVAYVSSKVGTTTADKALTYLLGFVDYMISTGKVSYSPFTGV